MLKTVYAYKCAVDFCGIKKGADCYAEVYSEPDVSFMDLFDIVFQEKANLSYRAKVCMKVFYRNDKNTSYEIVTIAYDDFQLISSDGRVSFKVPENYSIDDYIRWTASEKKIFCCYYRYEERSRFLFLVAPDNEEAKRIFYSAMKTGCQLTDITGKWKMHQVEDDSIRLNF